MYNNILDLPLGAFPYPRWAELHS